MALALFVAVALAYQASPKRDLLDAKYALLTSEALLRAGSWDLAPYLPGVAARLGNPAKGRSLWQLRAVGDEILYLYPPGTPLLATAPLAILRLGGATTLDARGRYDARRELWLQELVAALFGATAV
ncbi:MAG: hypothetical protein ACREQY_02040, partial [Candidatus Binatia bacterium]